MRVQHTIILIAAVIVTNLLITGCSKSSSQQTQADRQIEASAIKLPLTNSLEAFQTAFEENDLRIAEAQKKVVALRKKYNVHDTSPTQLSETNLALASSEEPYWAAKRNLAKLIDFQRVLQAKIMAIKIEATIPKAEPK